MSDGIYRTRSLGAAAEGIPDQYADGKAARVWEAYIGGKQTRTDQYRTWIVELLRRHGVRRVLDAACGNGVDSMMLVEEDFQVVSTDASDKMLKYALKERWQRRRQPAFDRWIIEEGNWLTLYDDVRRILRGTAATDPDVDVEPARFDAVICLGNSFAHLPDVDGHQANHRRAIGNFRSLLRPGGILVIDHRNYDEILTTGRVPAKNVYYNSSHVLGIRCSTLNVDGKPTMVTMDYDLDLDHVGSHAVDGPGSAAAAEPERHRFRLSYYPHLLADFTRLLKDVFGADTPHQVYGDFKPLGSVDVPAYYIHVVQRSS